MNCRYFLVKELMLTGSIIQRMQQDPPAGVSASPVSDNVMTWNAVIIGPSDTPFEDGTFRLLMQFDEQYPNKPPSVRFISQMFHPNVYASGDLCLDILQNRWSPTYDVAAILTSIQRYFKEYLIHCKCFDYQMLTLSIVC